MDEIFSDHVPVVPACGFGWKALKENYWKFFWPLTLMGLAMLLANQFQNGTLARYPEAARELAVFAIASSVFALHGAALIFVPQMTNVYCRSRRGARVCFRFVLGACAVLTLPVAVMAFTPPGRFFVELMFGLDERALDGVVLYLRLLTPMLVVNGLQHYCMGLLVQSKRTGLVTILNLFYLAGVLAVLVFGFQAGWRPIVTVALSQILPAVMKVILCGILLKRIYRLPHEVRHENLTYRETFAFFWPVALTSIMFALSRPVIYAFVSRMPDSVSMLAALRVAFDFSMVFFNPLNQFRHLYVTFGLEDPEGVRRFMVKVMFAAMLIMLLVVMTPLNTHIFNRWLGVEGEVLDMAVKVMWVLCLIPLAMTLRNYFHGLSLVHRTTGRMGVGGVARVAVIFVLAWALATAGWLNHMWAAMLLVLGFLVEAITVMAYTKYRPPMRSPEVVKK